MSTGYGRPIRGHYARSLESANEALERAFNAGALVWAMVKAPGGAGRARLPCLDMTNVYELARQGADVQYVVRPRGGEEIPL